MKRLCLVLIFIAFFALPCLAAFTTSIDNKHTWDNAYRWTGKPKDLLLDWAVEVEDRMDGTTGNNFLYLTPDAVADQTSEGTIYYDSDTDNLYYRNASSWVTIAASTSSTLAEAYAAGSGITVDTSAITLTVSDTANNAALIINANDATNNANGIEVVVATGNTGAGLYVNGTTGTIDLLGDNFSMANTGVLTIVGAVAGASGVTLANGEIISNGTNDMVTITSGDEDLTLDFTTGAQLVTLSSTTGVTTIDFAALTSIIGLTTITGDAADFTMSITADAGGEDLIISQAGSVDGSVQILSAGTGADAIDIETTAGGISVASAGAAMDILLDATAGAVYLDSGEAAADDAIVIVTTGAGSGMQITSLADIDITTTGAAAEDISITNTGGSVIITATEAITDAILIDASTAGAGIDITSGEDIDISTTGAAGEDITLTNTGGSIILTASEAVGDAVQLISSNAAGGIDITSGTGDLALVSTDDITLTVATAATDAITITNTAGTDAAAIAIQASAGGIDVDALDDISLALTSSTAGEDILLTTTGAFDNAITLTSSGTLDDAIGMVTTAGGINIAMSGGAAGEDFEITTATSIDFSSTEAAADQFKMDATGVIAGNAINLETTDGGIVLTADGATNGDILVDAESVITVTAGAGVTMNLGTGASTYQGNFLPATIKKQTITTGSLTTAHCGYVNQVAVDAQTITLPATVAGVTFWIMNTAADDASIITIDCDNADKFIGSGLTPADGETIVLTKATSNYGDYVKVTAHTDGWIITEMVGIWAEGVP